MKNWPGLYRAHHLPYVLCQNDNGEIEYIVLLQPISQVPVKLKEKYYAASKVTKSYGFRAIFTEASHHKERITLEEATKRITEFLKGFKEVKKVEVTSTPEGLLITVFFPESIDDETVDSIIDKAYEIVGEIERKNPDLIGQIFIGEGFE